ncbi:MAG: glycoside hydrolase family 16 protein [Fibrobacter sp.]|nr:glycoside hydrolase family 16 protein [Fibrobacter sp.]
MLQKLAASLITVTIASAFFFACSSDSSSSGPAEETPASSSDKVTDKVGEPAEPAEVTSSSDKIATNSSSSLRLSSANLSSSSIDVSVSAETSSSNKATDKVGEPTEPAEVYLWHDEFDSIDTTKWTFETGTGASGWGNNEWQYYTGRSENAYVQDGILHIRANKEDYEGAKYTSARMITKGKYSFTYGTVEARIALPVGKGIWPAFWMLGENIDAVSWPACGEIDIIEAVNSESIVYGTNHWQTEGNQADYGNNTNDFHGAKKELDITQFHTYKMVWNSEVIAMYVDDFKYHEISIKESAGGTDAFHKPQFFILNVAVAGNWPGFEVDDTQFPNEMLVDYIRVTR